MYSDVGELPRGRRFYRVRKGIMNLFGPMDGVIHKTPMRLRDLRRFWADGSREMLQLTAPNVLDSIILNYWGALRISELLFLSPDTVTVRGNTMVIKVVNAKNHLEPRFTVLTRMGEDPLCPVAAMERVMTRNGGSRRLFRHGRARHNKVVRAIGEALGLGECTPHSLRAGFATDCDRAGIPARVVMRHGRWASEASLVSYAQPDLQDLRATSCCLQSALGTLSY